MASTVIGGAISSAVYTAVEQTTGLGATGLGHGLRLGGSVLAAGTVSADLVRPAINKAGVLAAGTTAAVVGGAAGLLAYGTIKGLEYMGKGAYAYGKTLLAYEPLYEEEKEHKD